MTYYKVLKPIGGIHNAWNYGDIVNGDSFTKKAVKSYLEQGVLEPAEYVPAAKVKADKKK